MKLTIQTAVLKAALARCSFIPGGNGPILQTNAVTLAADMEGLIISRTTTEARISIPVTEGVEIEDSEGDPMVSHERIFKVVQLCRTQQITIESDKKNVIVTSGNAVHKRKVFEEDALSYPEISKDHSLTMPVHEFRANLQFAAQAMRMDGNDALFEAVCIRGVDGAMWFIGSDRRRTHIAIRAQETDMDVLIPSEGVSALLKAIDGLQGDAEISASEKMFSVEVEGVTVSVGVLEDKYINVATHLKAVDKGASSFIELSKEEFMGELKSCTPVVDNAIIYCDVHPERWNMKGNNSQDGDVITFVDCKTDKPRQFGLNGEFARAALDSFIAEQDGKIRIIAYDQAIAIKQSDRMAYIALTPYAK